MQDTFEEVVGKTTKEALKIIRNNGLIARTMREDKEGFMGTCEYRPDRVNLEIDKGVVTKAYFG